MCFKRKCKSTEFFRFNLGKMSNYNFKCAFFYTYKLSICITVFLYINHCTLLVLL